MWYVEGVGVLRSPRGLTLGGVQYPRNIFTQWTKADLVAIGIKPYSETSVDHRYYVAGEVSLNKGGDEVIGTPASSEKDAADIKQRMLDEVKTTAVTLLNSSDWMVVRAAEGGTAVSADWTTYRAAVRTESNSKDTAIAALTDVTSIKTFDAATPITEGWPTQPE